VLPRRAELQEAAEILVQPHRQAALGVRDQPDPLPVSPSVTLAIAAACPTHRPEYMIVAGGARKVIQQAAGNANVRFCSPPSGALKLMHQTLPRATHKLADLD
jgi:hypothetical protein